MVQLDEVAVSLSCAAGIPDTEAHALSAAWKRKLGEHLAIIEDELRREFGDAGIDWQ